MLRRRYDDVTIPLRSAALRLSEPVAHAADRLHARKLHLGVEELGAQPRHVDVNGPGLDEPVLAPNQIEQLVAAEHAARRADQGGQQLEFLGGEIDGAARDRDLEALAVDLEAAGLETAAP